LQRSLNLPSRLATGVYARRMQVIVYVGVSIDGFIARPGGEVDFLDTEQPPADDMGFGALLERVDVLVMGRNTFDFVIDSGFDWPYGELPVRVATSRPLELAPELEATVATVAGATGEIVASLEAEGFATAYVDGGALAAAFFADDLVDELVLTFVPVVIGDGIRLFGDTPGDLAFDHRATTSDPNGFVQIRWDRRRPTE
jgi:dihydrofolate reductase